MSASPPPPRGPSSPPLPSGPVARSSARAVVSELRRVGRSLGGVETGETARVTPSATSAALAYAVTIHGDAASNSAPSATSGHAVESSTGGRNSKQHRQNPRDLQDTDVESGEHGAG